MGVSFLKIAAPLVGSILSSAMAPSAPSPAPAPSAPAAASAPKPPTASDAPDIAGPEAVVDTEAARIRAQKRRTNSEQRKLFSLSSTDDDSVSLTKSLLGG